MDPDHAIDPDPASPDHESAPLRSFLLAAVRVGAALLLPAALFPLATGTAAAHGGGLEASPSIARILGWFIPVRARGEGERPSR
jgi:hypothetical protein